MLVEIILLVFTASICEAGYGGGGYHNPHGYVHQAPHWPSEDWSEKPKIHTGYGVSGVPQFDHSSPGFPWGFHQGHGETFHHNPQHYVHQQPQQYANHQHQQYDNHQHWQYQHQHQQYENQHQQYENQHQQYQNKHPQYENKPTQNVNQPQGNENQPQKNVNQPQGNKNQPQQNVNQAQGNENQSQENVNQPQVNVNQPQENVNQPQVNVNQPQENVNQPEENKSGPQQNVNQPQQNANQPQENVNQPQENVNQPQQNANQPQQNVNQPQENVNQPEVVRFKTTNFRPYRRKNKTESSTSPSTSSNTSAPLLDAPAYIQSTDNSAASRVSEKKCYATYFPGDVFIAKPGEFPYMVAIGYSKPTGGFDYLCGGTLISENYILTAAHCAFVNGQRPAVARIGGARLDDNAPQNQPQEITDVMVHPDYNRTQVYNDIALLKLKNASSINPACLWTKADINYKTATVIGYGQTGSGLSTSNDLITVDLPLYSGEDCKFFYAARSRVERGLIASQLCAVDFFDEVRDTCPGDSGGPLLARTQVREKEIPFVLGVTSIGPGCTEDAPGVYTSVFPYLDWIEPIVWPGE